jgi:signal transduction histidine kinase
VPALLTDLEQRRVGDAMQAAEEERRRWARTLHDDTLQGLGALHMLLAAARRSSDPERLRAAVVQALSRIEQQIDGLRGLIRELRPAVLDELGPAAAIEGLASRAAERSGIAVTADVLLPGARHPPELETALFRIVQEALNNALRHAGAEQVGITVSSAGGALHMRIRDDGRGFDPGSSTDGFGLAGMHERVALLHGELEIASSSGGTIVSAAFPTP